MDPLQTVVSIDVWHGDRAERLVFDVSYTARENGDGAKPYAWHCLECGLSPCTRRRPGPHEGDWANEFFAAVLENRWGRYDAEYDQLMAQLGRHAVAAAEEAAYFASGATHPYSRTFDRH